MLKRRLLLIVVILLSLVALMQGQNVDFVAKNFSDKKGYIDAMNNIKKGDELFGYKKSWLYTEALDYYLKANEFNPNNAVLNFKIGVCFLNTSKKAQSLSYFLKAKELNPKVDPKINYAVAQAYHYNLNFDEAIAAYTEYLEKEIPQNEKATLTPVIQKKILECKNGKLLVTSPVDVTITNLGSALNSKYNDYAPLTVKADSFIIFTSRREDTKGKQIDMNSKEYLEDIFISKKSGTDWQMPVQLSSNISGSANDAATALTSSGFTLLLYKGLSGGGDIFESSMDNTGIWSVPFPVSEMNTQWHESSAYITNDGNTAFVVSNNSEKSLGGHDIFIMKKTGQGVWSPLSNIGLVVNSPYDEEGVFASADGTVLYFSSKGHNSMGGYDIFRTTIVNGEWTTPENLGYPINTPDDDLYMIAFGEPGKEEGYFTSARSDGLGLNDIYHFRFTPPLADTRSVSADTAKKDTTYSVDLYKGEPSDAFVNINDTSSTNLAQNNTTGNGDNKNDGENKTKSTTDNSSGQNGDNTITDNNSNQNSDKTITDNNSDQNNDKTITADNSVKTNTDNDNNVNTNITDNNQTKLQIPQQNGVVFHVQVGASRWPMPYKELKKRYPGSLEVTTIQHEGWYKYLIGKYEKYSDAKTQQRTCGTYDAWVVVYKNGTRVHIREVMDMLTFYPNTAMLCSLFHI